MGLTVSEQATLYFYEWEYRNRGYYHFDTPIDIEPPYLRFQHRSYNDTHIVDDGRVPSVLSSIGKFLLPPKEEIQGEESVPIEPMFLNFEAKPTLVGFSLSFPKGTEIVPHRSNEFLNMISFTEHLISFEIVGTNNDIGIQIVCSEQDSERIRSHIHAYFPSCILLDITVDDFEFNPACTVAIADFGVNDEFMRPIAQADSFSIDPLTSIIATMDSLKHDDIAVFQILFKGITSPLARDITYSVSDGAGGSFFADAPEMPNCAIDKISAPLFSVVMRIATQGNNDHRSQYVAQELARSITSISSTTYNKLIPLSNEGYDYDFHYYNVNNRLSNRLGCILNSKELTIFIHYPNKTVVSPKLGLQGGKTKQAPYRLLQEKYLLGVNHNNGVGAEVYLNDEMKLSHTHIIGATGVGKSTLIAHMMIEDMKAGNGCAIFDPHGDIIDDILLRIPEERKQDVIIIDPSDEKYSIGFNLLGASTDAEKIVLSSDLVSAFKRHATAWGDNMSAVLSNAINAFLESNRKGTLIELKRFLLEDAFRKEFLTSVEDPSIHYYWNHEYHMVKKGIAPLLTRIDTFLRPKVIRYMLAQTDGVDFKQCIDEKKIVLIKLSQGLIGEENSFLLGSLFLSKFNQVAQGRQSLPKTERHPYFIYLDEFYNFMTPSITRILSGARKYGLGLILAHQELSQIDDAKMLNSVISNPYSRICFRLGHSDAKRLESGFSYFEQSDLQALGIGEAIVRIGSSNDDFNLSTFPLSDSSMNAEATKDYIIENTRRTYSQPKTELDSLLANLLPKHSQFTKKDIKEKKVEIPLDRVVEDVSVIPIIESDTSTISNEQKEAYLKQSQEQERLRKHRSIQNYIRTIAHQRGYRVSIEEELPDGKRVDVGLIKNDIRIAIEVSVSNSNSYEAQNIHKCISHGYSLVYLVSESDIHLKNIQKEVSKLIPSQEQKKVFYIKPDELVEYLDIPMQEDVTKPPKRVKGWRIDVNYHPYDALKNPSSSIASKIKNILKNKK